MLERGNGYDRAKEWALIGMIRMGIIWNDGVQTVGIIWNGWEGRERGVHWR
jgi:hypothetical protein